MLALVEFPDNTTVWMPYGEYLSRRLEGQRMALNMVASDAFGTNHLMYKRVLLSQQLALVRAHKFDHKRGWVVSAVKWATYQEYLELKDSRRYVSLEDLRDGLGRWRPEFEEIMKRKSSKMARPAAWAYALSK